MGKAPIRSALSTKNKVGLAGAPQAKRDDSLPAAKAATWTLEPVEVFGGRPRRTSFRSPVMVVVYCFRRCAGCGRDIGGYVAYFYRAEGRAYHIDCLGSRIHEARRALMAIVPAHPKSSEPPPPGAAKIMTRQLVLPHVPRRPTKAEIRAEMKARVTAGFELRQAERERKRAAKKAKAPTWVERQARKAATARTTAATAPNAEAKPMRLPYEDADARQR